MFIHLTVVAVDKQFVLTNLNDCLWTSLWGTQGPCAVLYFYLCLYFTLYQIASFFKKIKQGKEHTTVIPRLTSDPANEFFG